MPAHIHWTCSFPSLEGILESNSSLFPACETAIEVTVIGIFIKHWVARPYLGWLIHYRSSWLHHVSPLPVPQVSPTLGPTKDYQLRLLGPWKQAGQVSKQPLLFCTSGSTPGLFTIPLVIHREVPVRVTLPIPIHFFQFESYMTSSRTSDLCDFPIARVVPETLFVIDHSVSRISPSTWPMPWMKLSENFGKQSTTWAPKCHFPTAGVIWRPDGISKYLLPLTLRLKLRLHWQATS